MDMAHPVREQIYGAIRALTGATGTEAQAATEVIIRLIDNSLPEGKTFQNSRTPIIDEQMVNVALDAADFCRNPATQAWMKKALMAVWIAVAKI